MPFPLGRALQPARLIGLIWGGMGSADTLNAPRAILERMMPDAENTLIFTLDSGDVTIRLRPDLAPGHVERIKELTREGFYDGVLFPGVIAGFRSEEQQSDLQSQ